MFTSSARISSFADAASSESISLSVTTISVEQLTLDHVARRGGRALFFQLLHCEVRAIFQLSSGDRLVVDDRDDAVDHDGLARLLCAARRSGEKRGQQQGREGVAHARR
jgi:hypothetical protein